MDSINPRVLVQSIRILDQVLAEAAEDLASGDRTRRVKADRSLRRRLRSIVERMPPEVLLTALKQIRRDQERTLWRARRGGVQKPLRFGGMDEVLEG